MVCYTVVSFESRNVGFWFGKSSWTIEEAFTLDCEENNAPVKKARNRLNSERDFGLVSIVRLGTIHRGSGKCFTAYVPHDGSPGIVRVEIEPRDPHDPLRGFPYPKDSILFNTINNQSVNNRYRASVWEVMANPGESGLLGILVFLDTRKK